MVSRGSRQRSSTPYSSSLPAAGGSGSAARCRPSRVSASLPGADLRASATVVNLDIDGMYTEPRQHGVLGPTLSA